MALTTLQMPFARFHGKARTPGTIGGQVAYQVGQVGISRALVTPANPQSDHQVGIRAILAAQAAGYKALSAANAATWVAAAADVERSNILGSEYSLDGIGLYCMVNSYRAMNGQAPVSTAPTVSSPASPTSITSVTITGGNAEIIAVHPLSAGFIYARITQALGSAVRNARSNDYRTITTAFSDSVIAVGTSPQTLTLSMDEFTLSPGDYVGVSLLPLSADYTPGTAYVDTSILTV